MLVFVVLLVVLKAYFARVILQYYKYATFMEQHSNDLREFARVVLCEAPAAPPT